MGSEAKTKGARPAIAVAAAGLIIAGCAAGGAGSPARSSPSLRLVAYDNCSDLLSGLRKATSAHVGPYGLAGGPIMHPGGRIPGDAKTAAPAGKADDHSTTNTQEPGVDEPDTVKTDGRRIVTASGGSLQVVDAASHKETGTLSLSADAGWASDDLLLSGDRVLVIMRPAVLFPRDDIGKPVPRPPQAPGPRAVLVDIKSAPRVVASMQLDGSYVDARQTGSVARLVVRSTPDIAFPQRPQGTKGSDAVAANRAVVQKAPLDAWLPRYSVTRDGRTQKEKVPCEQVSHTPSFTGTSLVSVLSVDLAGDMADASPVSVTADGQTVYGSGNALYVTDRVSQDVQTPPDARTLLPVQSKTDIYRFDLPASGRPRFTASGSVPGDLINQYAMSEYQGNLRVATTTAPSAQRPGDSTASTSTVYVLGRHGPRLDQIGKIGGLGRGERIYAVRFIGPVGYVVTFRQTDPLYTVDLRDPAHPKETGSLKISGYSAYLHPAGDGRLIGVGQETDAKGRPEGTQVSLFDVSDPAAPKKLDGYKLGSGWSAAEMDPHAFLYWPKTGMTVLPTQNGATVLKVTASGIEKSGTVDHATLQRALLVGDTLWTLSPQGLQANDAETLHKTATIKF